MLTFDDLIHRVVTQKRVEPRAMLHGLLCGLARNHRMGAEAFPDYAAPDGTSGAVAEILGLQHWNNRLVSKYSQDMPPLASLLEALWTSITRESMLNEDHAVKLSQAGSAAAEQNDERMKLAELAERQDALRWLLEVTLSNAEQMRRATRNGVQDSASK